MQSYLWQFLVLNFAGWVNRSQQEAIEYLKEEKRVLRGFGARIALDSGKRFDSVSRYIEDRGDEPMAARKSSRVNRKYKTKYRVTNWREYERGLRSRGDITVWFSDEAREAWTPPKNGRRGGQPRYLNLAIVTALTLRMVFHLPLQQTEGFLDSLLRLMELDLKAPDHNTLSRRNQDVDVPCPTRAHDGALHLIVDSTGLKIIGCR